MKDSPWFPSAAATTTPRNSARLPLMFTPYPNLLLRPALSLPPQGDRKCCLRMHLHVRWVWQLQIPEFVEGAGSIRVHE